MSMTKIPNFIIIISTAGLALIHLHSLQWGIEKLTNEVERCSKLSKRRRYLDDLPYWDKTQLIDLRNFKFISAIHVCDEPVDLLVLILSAAAHLQTRGDIRNTFGSERPKVKILFLLGAVENATLQSLIYLENLKYRDIVQGSFIDAYRNLTYKHVMGMKYMIYFCPEATYTLKVDDDVYLHFYHILKFIEELEDFPDKENRIFCYVNTKREVLRGKYKWSVTKEEYADDLFPLFCHGPMVFYDYDVAFRLYTRTQQSDFFWLEDVLITGIAAKLESIKFFDLNMVLFDHTSDVQKILNGNDPWKIYFGLVLKPDQKFKKIHEIIKVRRKDVTVIKYLQKFQNKNLE